MYVAEPTDQLIRSFFDSAADAMAFVTDDRYTLVNAAWVRLYDWPTARAFIGQRARFLDPTSQAEADETIRQQRDGTRALGPSWPARGIKPDDTAFEISLWGRTFLIDAVEHQLWVCRGARGEARISDELTERVAFYKALFEVNSAVKLLIDPVAGVIVDANPAAADFYGWPIEELRGKLLSDVNTLGNPQLAVELENSRAGRKNFFRFHHRTRSGDIKDVEIYTGPFRHGDRDLLLSIVHDITERRILEAQLAQAQKMDAIGQLAGGVAHDFNNLLTVVLGYADILQGSLSTEGPHSRPLAEIIRAATQAKEVNRKLLTFSRRDHVAPRVLDLVALTEGLLPVVGRLLGERTRVDVDIPRVRMVVRADPGQVEQVLLNLLINARDSMPNGGAVHVSLGIVALRRDAELPDGAYVNLGVSDTGVGIPEATLHRIFEPFYTTKPPGQGTGLGLSIVYGTARQSGGAVRVQSTVGVGTRFDVLFPVVDDVVEPTSGQPAPGSLATGRADIALVEDQPAVRELLARALETAGHRVSDFASAEALLADPALDTFDLLISDVVMPGLSGFDLARRVREARPDHPILLVSGHLNQVPGDDLADIPILHKPFTSGDLLREANRLLERAPRRPRKR